MLSNNYQFEIPDHHKSIIKVIGVGGGGSNAVNHMYSMGIKDVEFVVSNTDLQALKSSPIPNRLQLGNRSLGAGANPEIGKHSAMESKEEIREYLSDNTKMLFITAGMGGGTGTGAAPVIAKIAREMDILTVGIVTAPFSFEGKRKNMQAEQGIAEMRQYCDTVLVIVNDKLREVYGNLSLKEAFGKADDILLTAAKSIAEIITINATMNIDFEDVRTVMKDSGAAVMGSGKASGENRARQAAELALHSPLLNNTNVKGAGKILFSVTYGPQANMTMDELSEITDYIQEEVASDAFMIWGYGEDTSLGEELVVTVIATGYEANSIQQEMEQRKVIDLETDKVIKKEEPIIYKTKPMNPNPTLFSSEPEKPKQEERSKIIFSVEPKEEPKREQKQEYIIHDLENDTTEQVEKVVPIAHTTNRVVDEFEDDMQKKFDRLNERKDKLKSLSANSSGMTPEEFKQMLEVPAYKRNNTTLSDYPHSSERNISRFQLNEDNEILGNNKFLHDNVD
ncbi:MAG TPA: cell division protein FtsZ [Cytophagaceae bacterium]|jgi:cell division protein FtsZ|nr:cell division protein FtsZ [Cytophagaceae bacterium]